jgi:hypothetical protein
VTELTPAYFVVCTLLAVAGARKIVVPRPTRESIALVRLRIPASVVRALGAAELSLAGIAAIWPTPVTTGLVALAYGAFCVFVLLLLVRHPGSAADCGCFGGADDGVGRLHLALNVLACGVAAAGTAVGVQGVGWVVGRSPLVAPSLIIGMLAASYAAYLAYTVMPRAWGSYGSGAAR